MQKELTVFIICILALAADVLCLWQILNFRVNGTFLIDEIYGGAIITSLAVVAFFLLWFGYLLLRKIIDRRLD